MTIAKIRMTVLLYAMVLSVGGLASATPVIKDWSSEGGHTQNKTNAKDTMYLVNAGDKITFSVKADGAEKYVWQVNKKVQAQAAGDSLTWTVPNEKGIWEIHLTAAAGKKEFAYTITVDAGGRKKVITGVNPGPHWYRPDPNKPTYTITAVLDGKTETEAELRKNGFAGSP